MTTRALMFVLLVACGSHGPVGRAVGQPKTDPDASAPCDESIATRGAVGGARFDASHDTLTFCLDASAPRGTVKRCFRVALGTGSWENVSELGPDPAERLTLSRKQRVRADARSVEVCSAKGEGCHEVHPKKFAIPRFEFSATLRDHIPADASPDGKRVFLVRHEGPRGDEIFGETYDTAKDARLARFPLTAAEHVDRVFWLGKRVLLLACLDEVAGCALSTIDPATGKAGKPLVETANVDEPVHAAGPSRFAIVETGGGRITFVDDTGKIVGTKDLPHRVDGPVDVVRRSDDEIAIVYGAPSAGIVIVRVADGTVVRELSLPPTC